PRTRAAADRIRPAVAEPYAGRDQVSAASAATRRARRHPCSRGDGNKNGAPIIGAPLAGACDGGVTYFEGASGVLITGGLTGAESGIAEAAGRGSTDARLVSLGWGERAHTLTRLQRIML